MKTYSKASDEVAVRAASLIRKYHPDLNLVDLKIDFIFIASSEDGEPALLHQGYPAAAVVKIVGNKERAVGRGDAEIVIDEAVYMDMADPSRDALLDHELYHLEVLRNKHGKVKLDEHGRPKLQMRLHDRQFGWFDEIASRHGSASLECQQAMGLYLSGKQIYFEFALAMKDSEDGVSATVKLMK